MMIDAGRRVTAPQLVRAMQRRTDFKGRFRAIFDEVDVLAVPVFPFATPKAAEVSMEAIARGNWEVAKFTMMFDLTGSPSLTLPAGVDPEGMPIGIQLIGPDFAEDRLFAL